MRGETRGAGVCLGRGEHLGALPPAPEPLSPGEKARERVTAPSRPPPLTPPPSTPEPLGLGGSSELACAAWWPVRRFLAPAPSVFLSPSPKAAERRTAAPAPPVVCLPAPGPATTPGAPSLLLPPHSPAPPLPQPRCCRQAGVNPSTGGRPSGFQRRGPTPGPGAWLDCDFCGFSMPS